jgi:hypothetical protein
MLPLRNQNIKDVVSSGSGPAHMQTKHRVNVDEAEGSAVYMDGKDRKERHGHDGTHVLPLLAQPTRWSCPPLLRRVSRCAHPEAMNGTEQ